MLVTEQGAAIKVVRVRDVVPATRGGHRTRHVADALPADAAEGMA